MYKRQVHDVALNLEARKPVVLPDDLAAKFAVRTGDVFVSRSNTKELVGLSSVASCNSHDRLIFPDLLIRLEADMAQVIPRYLAYALRTPSSRRQIKDRAFGSSQSMVKISGARLKEVEVSVPPISEQERLVDQFDRLHNLTSKLEVEMDAPEIRHLKSSVLNKALAGEL